MIPVVTESKGPKQKVHILVTVVHNEGHWNLIRLTVTIRITFLEGKQCILQFLGCRRHV
ncbi:hypothetical protein D1872_321860 [compost metagenome]